MEHTRLAVALPLAIAVLLSGVGLATAGEVTDHPPEAEAGLDQHVEQGDTVLLDAGGSWDPDGSLTATAWRIEAPNGTVFRPDCPACTETSFVPHRNGTYNVTLTVTDDDGASRSDTLFVVVGPADPPTVDLTLVGTYDGSTAPVRAEAAAGANELRRLVWRVDGDRRAVEAVNGTNASSRRRLAFATNGTHDVSVTVADWVGRRDTDSITVDDSGNASRPPTIDIVTAPDELPPGTPGRFVARAADPDGGNVSIAWDRGGRTGSPVQLSFPGPGDYTVTAVAEDDEGETASDEVTVAVNASSNAPPSVAIVSHPTRTLETGESGSFTAVASDPDGDPVSLTWSGGGGDSGTDAALEWDAGGQKTVTVTATDSHGASARDSVTVEVSASGGGDPVAVSFTNAPDTLEVGENGTFRAVAYERGTKAPVPIVWHASGRTQGGSSATFSWTSPGTKTVKANAVYNASYNETITKSVEVKPRSGPVADVNIDPKCEPQRSQNCGPVTGNPHDPVELSAEPSKAGGGNIVSYTWTVNGSLVSNAEVFEKVYTKGPKHVTLTVEDEHGETDTSNRTFFVEPSNDIDVSIELADSIGDVCPDDTGQCSWNPDSKTLTVVRGATSTFTGEILGTSDDGALALEWVTPKMTASDTHKRIGDTQTLTWASTGTGTIKLRGYQTNSYDQVVSWDTATVKVVDPGNQKPKTTITNVEEICNQDSRETPAGCSKTDAVEVTYQVWDPDENDTLRVNGFMSPENAHPIANERFPATKTWSTTQPMPVSKDGQHTFRLTVDDGRAVTEVARDFGITNATGGGGSGGGGIVVDGKWSLAVELDDTGSKTQADVRISCDSANQSTKCPGKRVKVNWGDGSKTTVNSNYEKGDGSWEEHHYYSGDGYPTLSVVVLSEYGSSITTLQRYLDLGDNEAKATWEFDEHVKTTGDKPDDWQEPKVHYDDPRDIEEAFGGNPWVEKANASMLNDEFPWITIIDQRQDWSWTNQYQTALVAPYCGQECRWVKVNDDWATKRARLEKTEWFDDSKSGLKYELVTTAENKIGSKRYYVESKLTDDSWYADECPSGPVTCELVDPGSGTDYRYKVYNLKHLDRFRKQTGDVDYRIQKYYTTVYERWVNVEW
jgi:hypothetical protein